MVAIVTIQEVTGATATYTNLANNAIRLFTTDATTSNPPQTTYPVIIPASSTGGYSSGPENYSYWKTVCLLLTGVTGLEIISNILHYSNGDITGSWTFGTNGQMQRGMINGTKGSVAQGCPPASYQQAAGTQGTTGYPITDSVHGHAYYKTSPNGVADLNADTSASPALMDAGPYTLSSPVNCNAVVLQVKVDWTATQGTQPSKTLTWQYDES